MDHYLRALFNPKSVAIIGASATSERGANAFLRRARSQPMKGHVYAVGRNGGSLDGEPIYRSITDLPEAPELVFGAVGLGATTSTMVEAAAAGAKVGIVFTAGFAEMGQAGADAEADLVAQCNALGMRIVGPNCMGVADTGWGLSLADHDEIAPGSIGFVSQSGNIAITLFDHAKKYELGFRSFVSVGNQADISMIDYIEYMASDDDVQAILLYIESLQEDSGSDFIERCKNVAARKPIVALKGGMTGAGRRAAASHTARLSSEERVYEEAFRQAGIVQVKDLDHVLGVVEALVRCPPMLGANVAIVGSGGGHSTVGTDCVERAGLNVPTFDHELRSEFRNYVPPWAPVSNPLDMTGGFTEDLTLFQTLMRYPLNKPEFDGGLSYGLYGDGWRKSLVDHNGLTFETAARTFGDLQREVGKPIVFYTPYAKDSDNAFSAMRLGGVPCYGSLAEAAAALAALRQRGEFLHHSTALHVLPATGTVSTLERPETPDADRRTLTEYESLSRISAAGVPTCRYAVVETEQEAVTAARAIGYPIVMKAQVPGLVHKSDVNAVRLGLASEADTVAAFHELSGLGDRTTPTPCTIAEQLRAGRELLVGVRQDATFGHAVVIGVGGTLTEVMSKFALLVPPFSMAEFTDALLHSSIRDYLAQWRGQPPVDLEDLYETAQAVYQMCRDDDRIQSVDINPLIVLDGRGRAVDAAIVLGRAAPVAWRTDDV